MKKVLTAMVFTLVFTVVSFAHGGAKHVMGTVKEISKDSITITTTDNQTKTVALTAKTQFMKSGQATSAGELKAGDRVVIEAKEAGGKLVAESVRFGKPAEQKQMMKMNHDMSKMSH